MLENTNFTAKELAEQKKNAAKERMMAFERSEHYPHVLKELERIEKAVLSRAAATNDGNLDTKTIGILRGLAYAKNLSKFVE